MMYASLGGGGGGGEGLCPRCKIHRGGGGGGGGKDYVHVVKFMGGDCVHVYKNE